MDTPHRITKEDLDPSHGRHFGDAVLHTVAREALSHRRQFVGGQSALRRVADRTGVRSQINQA